MSAWPRRKRRDDARRQLEAGTDPLAERKHEKLVAVFKAANTFGEIAKEYIDKQVAQGQADTTTQKANWLLEQLEPIAARPVADLKPIDLLAALNGSRPRASTKQRGVAGPLPVESFAMPLPPGAAKATPVRSCAARLSCRRSSIMRRSLTPNRWASFCAR